MTDYYVMGTGYTTYGPYTEDDALACARAFAHEHDGDRSAEIVGTVKYEYSRVYDDELPPEPRADAPRPWED